MSRPWPPTSQHQIDRASLDADGVDDVEPRRDPTSRQAEEGVRLCRPTKRQKGDSLGSTCPPSLPCPVLPCPALVPLFLAPSSTRLRRMNPISSHARDAAQGKQAKAQRKAEIADAQDPIAGSHCVLLRVRGGRTSLSTTPPSSLSPSLPSPLSLACQHALCPLYARSSWTQLFEEVSVLSSEHAKAQAQAQAHTLCPPMPCV